MPFTHDVIIIGQGLAGTLLSETFADRGLRVMVFDAPRARRSSAVATGIINPIVLRRTVPTWRGSEMLAIAGAYYRELELDYDASFWRPMPLVELFPTAQEAGLWHARMKEEELARMIALGSGDDPAVAQLPQPYGCGMVKRCAWLDIPALLLAHRERWMRSGALEERAVEQSDVRAIDGGVELADRTAPVLVWCAGPFHSVKGLVPVRGEGLTVRLPGLALRSIVHRGLFLLPIGDEVYRAGATFNWDDVWSGRTEKARHQLLDKLSRIWSGEVEVLDHWAGVRPAAVDRRPILGRIDAHQAVFTGLGSRGGLLAPWCAAHLADHLLTGTPLDPEVDLKRFTEQPPPSL
ncbi:MAG: FAD-binding oxidoreductase [Flavobacteriales bacterium]|nr:FAD-binding oxidoreductase [Flavobacteriales bacterium]